MRDVIDRVIEREGGFVNDPDDRGGATKFGITRATLAWYRQREVTIREVEQLTLDEARAIYDRRYWTGPRISRIPYAALAELVFDCAVNHGPRQAIRWLQAALGGVAVDGIIGAETLAALDRADLEAVRRDVLRRRIIFFGKLISSNPAQGKFAHGWLKRVAEFV